VPDKLNNAALDIANRLFEFSCQRSALRGQPQPPGQALEQRKSELFFERTDAVTDRTLCEVKLIRGIREAHVTGCYDEDPQRIERGSANHVTNTIRRC
jgi:hypothetical protein